MTGDKGHTGWVIKMAFKPTSARDRENEEGGREGIGGSSRRSNILHIETNVSVNKTRIQQRLGSDRTNQSN